MAKPGQLSKPACVTATGWPAEADDEQLAVGSAIHEIRAWSSLKPHRPIHVDERSPLADADTDPVRSSVAASAMRLFRRAFSRGR